MADSKISGLPSTTSTDGSEVLPIVQNGTTKQVVNSALRPKQILSNTTSGVLQIVGPGANRTRVMTVPDSDFTVAQYDEGAWTPADASGAGLVFTGVTATYVKVGNSVHVQLYLTYPITTNTNAAKISGLPFTAASLKGWSSGTVFTDASTGSYAVISQEADTISFFQTSNNTTTSNTNLSNAFIIINMSYFI